MARPRSWRALLVVAAAAAATSTVAAARVDAGTLDAVRATGRLPAQASGCVLQINGVDAATFSTPTSAFRTTVHDTVTVQGVSAEPTGTVKVYADVVGISVPVKDLGRSDAAAGEAWEGTIKIADYADLAVGWHHLEIRTQSCSQRFWVRIYGRNPLTTLLGAISAVVALVGAIGLVRGFRHRSWWQAALGGIPFGIGVSLLCAQFGLIPFVIGSVAGWIGGSSILGGAASAARAGASAPSAVPAPSATPSAPSPPPVTPAPSPSAPPSPSTPTSPASPSSPAAPSPASPSSPPGPAAPAPSPSLPPPESPWESGWAHGAPPDGVSLDAPSGAAAGAGPPGAGLPGAGPLGQALPPPQVPVSQPADGTADGEPQPDATITVEPEPADPPRSAYARIDAPEVVAPGDEFEVVVGLAPVPVLGVIGAELVRPPSSTGAYTLTAQVVADGFTIGKDESWRVRLPVTADEPYPTATIHLTATPQDVPIHARTVQVLYSIDGHPIGLGARSIAVVRRDEPTVASSAASSSPTSDARLDDGPDHLLLRAEGEAPDLTIRITLGSDDRLTWTFDSPIADLKLPDTPIVDSVVGDAERFATHLANQISIHEGHPGLYQHVRGIGLQIAEAMPEALWLLLARVGRWAANQGRAPTILLLSAEPYVPWELAVVDDPWDMDAAPFLGAQATVGRWVLRRRRPAIPPPRDHTIGDIAVVWGVYDRQGWSRLYAAEEEAAHLLDALPSRSVDATLPSVIDCLQGTPAVDAIHFAVHGTYDPAGGIEGLVLVDGQLLDPMTVQGATLHGAPFVYLNACQTGSGSVALSAYSGIAAAFLYAGACAVVAPLWKIGDNAAADAAESFYDEMFGGLAPAEVLRRQRATFLDDPDTTTATMLAFQFFGNPNLRVVRAEVPTS